ncbi:MAG: hypothetical protein SFU98_12740 [Leptospiraceae bacterium]|nr:hypothetical protein [Leptospiraceae bacterium]
MRTIDVSETGLYVNWANCDLDLGSPVIVSIDGSNRNAGVVRIDKIGVGLAFRR